MTPAVAVVDAETPGNVGTIARAMKNFGFSDLLLVDPPDLDPDGEAYGFAGRAREDVLPEARELSFDELAGSYHTVGFVARPNESDAKHVRYPFQTPAELAADPPPEPAALVFGRERTGLTNDEIARLDRLCSIPASADYPALNLGQAATIALYELREWSPADRQLSEIADRASPEDVERFHEHFAEFLAGLHYPDGKREKTRRLVRRLVGRAHPTERELITLRGVLRRAARSGEHDDSP